MRKNLLVVTAFLLASAGACTYSPDFGNDLLTCNAGACPKGYSCNVADNKCWKTGETPGGNGGSDGGTHPGTGGAKMDASSDGPTSSDPRDGFVGTWTFTGGTLNGSCSDGSTIQNPLNGNPSNGTPADYIVIGLGTLPTTLNAKYFCDTGWTLQLSNGNTMAVIAPTNQMCIQRTTDNKVTPPVTTAYTWSPAMFTFTKTNAMSATVSGQLSGSFAATDGTSGTCQLTFSGPLSKN